MYKDCLNLIERYQLKGATIGQLLVKKYDEQLNGLNGDKLLEEAYKANQEIADEFKKLSIDTLNKVLKAASNNMKNAFSRSDA